MTMKRFLIVLFAALPFAGCSDFLDPLPNGHYTDQNLLDYPSMIRGFVEKSYALLPTSYSGGEYVYLDGATDDVVITAQTNAMRRFAVGSGTPASDPFKTYWIRNYKGIMYANRTSAYNAPCRATLMRSGHGINWTCSANGAARARTGACSDSRSSPNLSTFSMPKPEISRAPPTTNASSRSCATATRRSTTSRQPTATGWPGTLPSREPCAGSGSTAWQSKQ